MTSLENNGAGQITFAVEAGLPVPAPFPNAEAGHDTCADEALGDLPAPAPSLGHLSAADEANRQSPSTAAGRPGFAYSATVPVLAAVEQLQELQVRRKFWISTVNRQSNAAKALVRRALGWRYDEAEGDREATNKRAARVVSAALAGKPQKQEDAEVFAALAADLSVIASTIEPCNAARHQIELDMKRIARKLPVYPWAKAVMGLGDLGLAVIVGEAGNLSSYPAKGHLWKRLGLAPFEGQAYSTWRAKGGLTTEQWTEAGYSPRRRAEVFAVVSEPLFRAQTVAEGPYRAIYDRRRLATADAHADWTKLHSHMDALRVMTKYLLRDLWQEWRRVKAALPRVGDSVSAAGPSEALA